MDSDGINTYNRSELDRVWTILVKGEIMKQEILENIDELKSDLIGLGDFIFDNPELGLEEYRSSREITDF